MIQWINQRITFDPKDRAKLQAITDLDFSFWSMLPMPKSIRFTQAPTDLKVLAYASEDITGLKETHPDVYAEVAVELDTRESRSRLRDALVHNRPFQNYCREYELPATLETLGNQVLKNLTVYDHPDWHEWTRYYWGSEVSPDPNNIHWGESFVDFRTANVSAEPMVHALSFQLTLALEWTDGDAKGWVVYKDGRSVAEGDGSLPK